MIPSVPASPSSRWLFGPLPDLLLGCGIGYGLIFTVLVLVGPQVRAMLPDGLMPLVLLVTGTPHYGATLLRVYERAEDRRAYVFFSIWATLAVWTLFLVGLHSVLVGSILLTIFLTWSPWHYTGQNYGVALMLLRRRGVEVTPNTKRLIYTSFLSSFVLTVLAIHGATESVDYAPITYGSTLYHFLPLGIPIGIQSAAFLVVGAVWLGALFAAGFSLLRQGTAADVAPAGVVAGVQALWFALPVIARGAGWLRGVTPFSVEYAAYTFLWVAVGHSVQYLWITAYFAQKSNRAPRLGSYLAKALCAGAAIWTVPALLMAPGVLGRVPFDAGLATMVAVAVNLHHFILDGAIWKLRDGAVARVLIRSAAPPEPISPAPGAVTPLRGLVAPALYLVGAACAAIIALATLEEEFGVRRAFAQGNVENVEVATARLERMGRASAELLANTGVLAVNQGDVETGRREIARSLELWPSAEGWRALGWLYQHSGEPEKAIVPYKNALALRPGWPQVSNDLAWIRATHQSFAVRDPAEAVRLAEQAARAAGEGDPSVLDTLAAAYAAAGRFGAAVKVSEQAAALAREGKDPELAAEIEQRTAGYRRGSPFREDPSAARRSNVRFDVKNPEGQLVNPIAPAGKP